MKLQRTIDASSILANKESLSSPVLMKPDMGLKMYDLVG